MLDMLEKDESIGYMIMSARDIGLDDNVIYKLRKEMERNFNTYTKEHAVSVNDGFKVRKKRFIFDEKLELLSKYYAVSAHDLLCYSENYGMTKPKEGYQKEYIETKKEFELLQEMIRDYMKEG